MKRILIAYFSRAGSNYVGGDIVKLTVGNTEVAATMIQNIVGGDLFKIDPTTTYPDDYREATEVARQELRAKARPELKRSVQRMEDYDIVALGYPNWWGTMPMAVWTFLESYDFSGKTILPLCTHEGSGMGHSEDDLKRLCPHSKVKKGLAIRGSNARYAEKDISEWLRVSEVL